MRQPGLVVVVAVIGVVLAFSRARAEDEPAAEAPAQPTEHTEPAGAAAEPPSEPPTAEEPAGETEQHPPAAAEPAEHAPTEPPVGHAAEPAPAADEDDEPYKKFDADGDGTSDPELEKEYTDALAGFSEDIDPDKVDAALDARPEDAELAPSITVRAVPQDRARS